MEEPSVERLTGVYDADSGLRGELSYAIGKVLGRRHCALCEVTHAGLRQKEEWRSCVAAVPIPFDLLHRDQVDPAVMASVGARPPFVMASVRGSWHVVARREEIERCEGDPARLFETIEANLARLGATMGASRAE
ncbi:MAG: hypothetical protein KatS3mg008_2038 [Acidimicrobiales bacterium]|nr:MAG: hypothetical protein KatS3mg008_2038 [Acidimicrobiales bacterium]